jgi:hypothetical protein
LFFWALASEVASNPEAESDLTVPLIDLVLDVRVVLTAAPATLSFLILAMTGAMRAYRYGREVLELGKGADYAAELVDANPNAIDLAFYASKGAPRPLAALTHFKYPLFLTVPLCEAAWLAPLSLTRPIAGRTVLVLLSVALWVAATIQVVAIWYQRFSSLPPLWRSGDG